MPTTPILWGPELTAPREPGGFNYTSDVAGLRNDRSVVVWSNYTTGQVFARILDPFGNPVFTFDVAGTLVSPSTSGAQVAALSNGDFVVTWNRKVGSDNDVYQQRFDANGTAIGAVAVVTNTAREEYLTDIASLSNGGWVVTYNDAINSGDVRAAIYNSSGVLVANIPGTYGSIGQQADAYVAGLNNGNFAVVYTDETGNRDTYVSIFNSTGQVVRLDQQVNNIVNGGTGVGAGVPVSQEGTGVASLSNGGFVVTFTHNYDGVTNSNSNDDDIYFQLYDSAGNRVGNNVGINTTTSRQYQTSVVGLQDGTFVVTFTDKLAETTGANISTKVYNNDGTLIGTITNFNATQPGLQFQSHVAALSDGRYIATWIDFTSGDARYEILDSRDGLLAGDEGSNTILGHNAGPNIVDFISGRGGNDRLWGLAGDDFLYGGDGNDELRGGIGSNYLVGDGGFDATFYSGVNSSAVTITRNGGTTTISGAGISDTLYSLEVARFDDRTIALREAARSDVSGDGAGDIVWFNSTTRAISYYELNASGSGYTWHNIGGVGAGYAPLTGDFNGDGRADIFWSNGANTSTYLMNADGSYTWRNYGSVGSGYTPRVGDFNGDGISDILWSNGTSVSTYLSTTTPNANGDYYTWRNIGGVSAGYTPYVGDFNGDGTSDILFFNGSQASTYLINSATGSYTWRNIGGVAPGYVPLVGDFTGDGTSDIAFYNSAQGLLSYYEINPNGGYAWHNIGAVGAGYTPFVRDFNNDGKADIGWTGNGSVSYYDINPTTNPAGGYTWHNIGGVGGGYSVVA